MPVFGKSIPAPFNDNDVTVWNAPICKYLCEKENSSFNGAVIDDKILPLGAYDKEMMKTGTGGNKFYRLIEFCLEYLRDNRLLKIKKEKNSKGLCAHYFATERLESICPEIEKVELPSIKSVLDTEREIRKEKNYRKIVTFLEHLEKVNEVRRSNSMKYVTNSELYKLAQLGVITLYLDGRISITAHGNILKPLLSQEN
ncbi:MAG: hypothetical protein WCC17_20825 [Candidatus Nitrosopolaris sp.]